MVSQVRSLIRSAPEHGWDCFLAAPEEVIRALAMEWPEEVRTYQEHTPLYAVGPLYPGPRQLLRHGELVGRWAQMKGATLIHGHGLLWSPLFAAAARRARVPLVVTLHNLVPDPAELSMLQKIAMRIALARAERIIAVSEAVAESARRALGSAISARLRVVRNGIDAAPFDSPEIPSKLEVRKSLALPYHAPLAICVARLSSEKGVDDLIEALVVSRTPGLHILIAGTGKHAGPIQDHAKDENVMDRMIFAGHRDDIPRLLRAADISVVPSREEGLGIAALEAAAAGLPVVATNAGGLPEAVLDGETGLLVPPRSPRELAAAIDTLLADPERATRFGKAGQARVRAEWTAVRMAAQTFAVYDEALARPSGGRPARASR